MYLQAACVAATLLPLPGIMTAWRQMAGLQTPGRQIAGFQTAWRLMAGLQTPGRLMAGLQRRVADFENLLIILRL